MVFLIANMKDSISWKCKAEWKWHLQWVNVRLETRTFRNTFDLNRINAMAYARKKLLLMTTQVVTDQITLTAEREGWFLPAFHRSDQTIHNGVWVKKERGRKKCNISPFVLKVRISLFILSSPSATITSSLNSRRRILYSNYKCHR